MNALGTPPPDRNGRSPDAQAHAALVQLTEWIEHKHGCCHVRMSSGEFDEILGIPRAGATERYTPHRLGAALHTMLMQMADKHPHHGRLQIGGNWRVPYRGRAYVDYLEAYDLYERVPWIAASQCFLNGIVTGANERAKPSGRLWPFLVAVQQSPKPTLLVVERRTRGIVKCFDGTWVPILPQDCWIERGRVFREILESVQPGSVVLYAAGTAAKPMAWRMWNARPDTSHIDVGHLFDRAFGINNRCWSDRDCPRRRIYDEHYAPFFRGEKHV